VFVSVVHHVKDPEKFWQAAEEVVSNLPEGVRLHESYPSADGMLAVCLWEADGIDPVRDLVEGAAPDLADNEYMEVDAANAAGLPQPQPS
jgi:hypothetical protein